MRILELLFGDLDSLEHYIYLKAIAPKTSADTEQQVVAERFANSREKVARFLKTYQNRPVNLYFGVGLRRTMSGKKEAVQSVNNIWLDLDHTQELPRFILPPTAVVSSGNGLHCYWKLDQHHTDLETVQIVVANVKNVLKADHCQDYARVLRIDNTTNFKPLDEKNGDYTIVSKDVKLILDNPTAIYTLADINNACNKSATNTKLDSMIFDGMVPDEDKGKTRSERDFEIISNLVKLQLSDKAIINVFDHYPCGDRYKERGLEYLTYTINKIRDETNITESAIQDIQESVAGIYVSDNKYFFLPTVKPVKGKNKDVDGVAPIPISNFCLRPKYIVSQTDENGRDVEYLMTDIISDNGAMHHIFTRQAFHSCKQFKAELGSFGWVWYPTKDDLVIALNRYLISTMPVNSVKKAVTTLGYYDGVWIGKNVNLRAGDWVDPLETDYIYINKQNHIDVQYNIKLYEDERSYIQNLIYHLTHVNDPSKIFPVIGWFCATLFKSRMSQFNASFPILNLFGTYGSGKTQTIFLLQRLACYTSVKTFDCMTTNFTIITLLSATTDVLISLSEYRESDQKTAQNLNRFLLLAYDQGTATRGRQDQSTNNYRFTSPITIDGEDAVSDPAILDRCVQIQMSKKFFDDSTEEHFKELQQLDLDLLGTRLIEFSMNKDFRQYLSEAQGMCSLRMSSRVKNNIEITIAGLIFFRDFMNQYGLDLEIDCDWFENLVVEQENGFTVLDTFVTDIINTIAKEGIKTPFTFRVDHDDRNGIIWIHFTTAYNFWRERYAKYYMGSHTAKAIKTQIKERMIGIDEPDPDNKNYMIKDVNKSIEGIQYRVYGIDIDKAEKSGLDIPASLKRETISVSIKSKSKPITIKTRKGRKNNE